MINKFLVLTLLFLVGCNGIELQLNSSEAYRTVNGTSKLFVNAGSSNYTLFIQVKTQTGSPTNCLTACNYLWTVLSLAAKPCIFATILRMCTVPYRCRWELLGLLEWSIVDPLMFQQESCRLISIEESAFFRRKAHHGTRHMILLLSASHRTIHKSKQQYQRVSDPSNSISSGLSQWSAFDVVSALTM